MNLKQSILTNNGCYKTGKKITVKGLMLHSVGCPQPSAEAFVKSWNKSTMQLGVHAFIDGNDGTIHQTLPWNHRGVHCGGSANNTHIGIEMCEPASIQYLKGSVFKDLDPVNTKAVVMRTYDAAVELFAYLCKQYKLNPLADGVIISHAEGCKRGVASNHGDPEHLWKVCGLSTNGFRMAVQARMNQGGTNTPPTAQKPVRVKITASALNIRSGAGITFPIVGCILDKGVYTITQTKGDWGKLKSGAGWINLKYTKKI